MWNIIVCSRSYPACRLQEWPAHNKILQSWLYILVTLRNWHEGREAAFWEDSQGPLPLSKLLSNGNIYMLIGSYNEGVHPCYLVYIFTVIIFFGYITEQHNLPPGTTSGEGETRSGERGRERVLGPLERWPWQHSLGNKAPRQRQTVSKQRRGMPGLRRG